MLLTTALFLDATLSPALLTTLGECLFIDRLLLFFCFFFGRRRSNHDRSQRSLQSWTSPISYQSGYDPDYKFPPLLFSRVNVVSFFLLPPVFIFFVFIKVMVLTDSFPCMILHRRNLACRGCGCPRSESQVSSMNRQALSMPSTRLPTSPRFASASNPSFFAGPSIPNSHYPAIQQGARYPLTAQPVASAKPPSPSHPLLTPSGRSFSVGGKVQNISSDPTVACIMYWPDNEPFPEQGQIRPSNLVGVPVIQFGALQYVQ